MTPTPRDTTPALLSEAEIAEIEARANAATAGPWRVDMVHSKVDGGVPLESHNVVANWEHPGASPMSNYPSDTPEGAQKVRNLELMAHAREDIPRLIAHIRELERRLNRRQERLNEIGYARNWTVEMLAAYEVGYEEGIDSVDADRWAALDDMTREAYEMGAYDLPESSGHSDDTEGTGNGSE